MPKISIVVPVYNVEDYIGRCVSSILKQTFDDFEVLLIDDGSFDRSGIICDEFCDVDTRIRTYHISNGGVSHARNFGIEHAKGEFICFVDSDDEIDETYLVDFGIKTEDADLYLQGYKKISENLTVENHGFAGLLRNSYAEILSFAEKAQIINSSCFKLFKTSIIKEHDVVFDLNTSYGEDHLFSLSYLYWISKIHCSFAMGYRYWMNSDCSLTKRCVPYKEMLYYSISARKIHNRIFEKHPDPSLKHAFNETFIDNFIRTIGYLFKGHYSFNNYQEIVAAFDRKEIRLAASGVSFKRKQLLFVVVFSPLFLSYSILSIIMRMRNEY